MKLLVITGKAWKINDQVKSSFLHGHQEWNKEAITRYSTRHSDMEHEDMCLCFQTFDPNKTIFEQRLLWYFAHSLKAAAEPWQFQYQELSEEWGCQILLLQHFVLVNIANALKASAELPATSWISWGVDVKKLTQVIAKWSCLMLSFSDILVTIVTE